MPMATLQIVIGISGVVGLLIPLGFEFSKMEMEITCFILGPLAFLIGGAGVLWSIYRWISKAGPRYSPTVHIQAIGVAFAVLAVGCVLVWLGYRAAVVNSHGASPHQVQALVVSNAISGALAPHGAAGVSSRSVCRAGTEPLSQLGGTEVGGSPPIASGGLLGC